jgi:hypothetical protein
VLVKLAGALAVGDVAVLCGTDMDLGGAASVPGASFAWIPHDAVPAIRYAVHESSQQFSRVWPDAISHQLPRLAKHCHSIPTAPVRHLPACDGLRTLSL